MTLFLDDLISLHVQGLLQEKIFHSPEREMPTKNGLEMLHLLSCWKLIRLLTYYIACTQSKGKYDVFAAVH